LRPGVAIALQFEAVKAASRVEVDSVPIREQASALCGTAEAIRFLLTSTHHPARPPQRAATMSRNRRMRRHLHKPASLADSASDARCQIRVLAFACRRLALVRASAHAARRAGEGPCSIL